MRSGAPARTDLAAVWATEAPRALDEDLAGFGATLSDPFAERTP